MDHVIRRMKFKKTAMGYTGSGYRSTARSPYGYETPRRPVATGVGDVWSSKDMDSCDDTAPDGLGEPSRDLPDFEAKRSRPQSLVKSHQNEYSELITADISLVE